MSLLFYFTYFFNSISKCNNVAKHLLILTFHYAIIECDASRFFIRVNKRATGPVRA